MVSKLLIFQQVPESICVTYLTCEGCAIWKMRLMTQICEHT